MYIYKFLNNNNEVLYVGKSKDIISRIANHKTLLNSQYDEVETIEFASVKNKIEMDIYELYYINKYSPKFNKKDNFKCDVSGLNLSDLDFKFKVNKDFLKYRDIKPLNFKFHRLEEIHHEDLLNNFNINLTATYANDNGRFYIKPSTDLKLIEYIQNDIKKYEGNIYKIKDLIDEIGYVERCPNSVDYPLFFTTSSDDESDSRNATEYIININSELATIRGYYKFRWFNDIAYVYLTATKNPNVIITIYSIDNIIYIYQNNIVVLWHKEFKNYKIK